MNFKEEYKKLVDFIKYERHSLGLPNRNEDLARELGYTATYFSSLVGNSGKVTEQHIKDIRLTFRDLFDNQTNYDRSMMKEQEATYSVSASERITELQRDKQVLSESIAANLKTVLSSQDALLMVLRQVFEQTQDIKLILDNQKPGQGKKGNAF
jgi:hypothetical protein